MPDLDSTPSGAPSEVVSRNASGPLTVVGLNGDGFRSWLRVAFGAALGALLVGDIFLYSHHQALRARVENQERRIERLNTMVDDLLITNENAQKIEKIEQQVESIDGQVQELTDAIKAQNAKPKEPEQPKRKRKKR